MSKTKVQAFAVEAIQHEDGLHLVLPSSAVRQVAGRVSPETRLPLYGLVIGGSIQLSYERLTLSIPAMPMDTRAFISNKKEKSVKNVGEEARGATTASVPAMRPDNRIMTGVDLPAAAFEGQLDVTIPGIARSITQRAPIPGMTVGL